MTCDACGDAVEDEPQHRPPFPPHFAKPQPAFLPPAPLFTLKPIFSQQQIQLPIPQQPQPSLTQSQPPQPPIPPFQQQQPQQQVQQQLPPRPPQQIVPTKPVCRDLNPEFCSFIASKPEYCRESVIVKEQNVLDVCPVTCGSCDRHLVSKSPVQQPQPQQPQQMMPQQPQQMMPQQPQQNIPQQTQQQPIFQQPATALPSFQQQMHLGQAVSSVQSLNDGKCKDMNPEFCNSIATKREYCADNVIVNNKRVLEICNY